MGERARLAGEQWRKPELGIGEHGARLRQQFRQPFEQQRAGGGFVVGRCSRRGSTSSIHGVVKDQAAPGVFGALRGAQHAREHAVGLGRACAGAGRTQQRVEFVVIGQGFGHGRVRRESSAKFITRPLTRARTGPNIVIGS